MRGFGGGFETWRCDSLVINANVPTPSAQRPIQNPSSMLDVWCRGSSILSIKLRPYRRVIGRFFSFPHVAIDSGGDAFIREGFAGEDRIDPQPAIFWKGEHPVYRSGAYRIERYKCVPGHYEIRGRV